MTELDFRILDFIREHFSSGPMDAAMKFFTFLGEAGWFWILIGIVLAAIPKTRRTGVTVLAALLLSLIVCNLTIKPLVGRIRPYDLRGHRADDRRSRLCFLRDTPPHRLLRRLRFLHTTKNGAPAPLL